MKKSRRLCINIRLRPHPTWFICPVFHFLWLSTPMHRCSAPQIMQTIMRRIERLKNQGYTNTPSVDTCSHKHNRERRGGYCSHKSHGMGKSKKEEWRVERMGLRIHGRKAHTRQSRSRKPLIYGKKPGQVKKPAENCMPFAQNP